ncbi:MAG: Na+/H+ antiporter NhaC family protein, partial [Muribaculaceae bacterium]|nr:Na+/H+ antiporter NhaC family protein [Muribaculaceae bacterium]
MFLLLYVAVSLIINDFYKMPIAVALVVASAWSVIILRDRPLLKRIEVFSRAAGHSNILYMIWVFVLAGAFATMAKDIGAVDATVALALRAFPPEFMVPMLFFASCFISLSIGTSVGTVVALTPLANSIACASGGNVPFFVAVVLGGAFFGDNLSFISDTTIAATRSQGCNMSDKFKANLWIALPAALATLAIYIATSAATKSVELPPTADPWLITPYMVVLATAIAGINVTLVLSLGLLTTLGFGLANGFTALDMASSAGAGIDGMGNLIIITLLASGMLGMIKEAGGIRFILDRLTRKVSGRRGGQMVIALLVGIVNLCTANNTVAIITVGGISRDISRRYRIDPRKSASLLDSTSCIVQCLIPYGAQTLLATSLAGISPAAPFRYLYYVAYSQRPRPANREG